MGQSRRAKEYSAWHTWIPLHGSHPTDPTPHGSHTPWIPPHGSDHSSLLRVQTARAFSLLPQSDKKGQKVPVERAGTLSLSSRLKLNAGEPLPPETTRSALPGGVLMRLGHYDLALSVIALSLAVLAASCFFARDGRGDTRSLGLTLYWIRTAHGLLSFPYLLFKLPLAHSLLTHARPTGYDRNGYTMPHARHRRDRPTEAPQTQTPRRTPRSTGRLLPAGRGGASGDPSFQLTRPIAASTVTPSPDGIRARPRSPAMAGIRLGWGATSQGRLSPSCPRRRLFTNASSHLV